MKWFKHDSDAHRDSKLVKVRMKYGLEGYGLYWYLIEEIVSGVDQNNITFQLEHDSEIIAFNTGLHRERIEEMMLYMVNLGLFEQSQGVITCLKLAKRLDSSMTSNQGMRNIISNIKNSHATVMIPSCPDKKRRDKKRKDNTNSESKSRFAEFWDIFADKRGKDGALRVWKRKKLDKIAGEVIDGARLYASTRGNDRRYWKQAQGWLNDGRWKDKPLAVAETKDRLPGESPLEHSRRLRNITGQPAIEGVVYEQG